MKFFGFSILSLFLWILLPVLSFAQYDTLTVRYPNGKIESIITYYKNYKEGPAKYFSDSGVLIEERMYKEGQVNGLVKTYYPDGKLKEVFNVIEGRREGPATVFDTSGQIISEKFYSQGKLSEQYAAVETEFDEDIVLPPGIEEEMLLGGTSDTLSIASLGREIGIKEAPFVPDESVFYTDPDVPASPKEGWDSLFARIVKPERARKENIGGTVELKVWVDVNGDVRETKIIKGIGYGCEDAAEIAIAYTKFIPAVKKGFTVNSELLIKVVFEGKPKSKLFNFFN